MLAEKIRGALAATVFAALVAGPFAAAHAESGNIAPEPPAGATAPAPDADNDRADAAWTDFLETEGAILADAQFAALNNLAFQAAAVRVCDGHGLAKETFGKAIGLVHGRSSFYANQRDGTPGRQVWYKYVDRAIRSERHYWACLHYIIANSVKHGFAVRMDEWEWSSYHELLAEHGPAWIDDLCREFPLHGFGKGWDDWRVGERRIVIPTA